jgi:hypothetical protein
LLAHGPITNDVNQLRKRREAGAGLPDYPLAWRAAYANSEENSTPPRSNRSGQISPRAACSTCLTAIPESYAQTILPLQSS